MKKDATIIVLGRVIQFVLNFLLIKFITKYFDKEQVAVYFLVLSVLNYFGLAMISPVGQFMNRSINQWSENKVLLNRIFNLFQFTLGLCVVTFPVFHFINIKFNFFPALGENGMVFLVLFGVVSNTILTVTVSIFNFLGFRISYVAYSTLMIVLSLGGSIFSIKTFGVSVFNWFLGHFVSQFGLFCVSVFHLSRAKDLDFSPIESIRVIRKDRLLKVFQFSAPLFISTFFMWLSTDSFRFILEKTHGLEYVGLISIGFVIAQKLSFAAESLIQQILFPYFYREMDHDSPKKREKSWLTLFYISLPCYLGVMIITMFASKFLILTFSDESYLSASSFVVLAAAFHFFRKVSATFALSAHSEKKTQLLVLPYFLGALVATIPLFLIEKSNQYFPAFVLVGSSFATCVAMWINTRKILTVRFDRDVIDAIKLRLLGKTNL